MCAHRCAFVHFNFNASALMFFMRQPIAIGWVVKACHGILFHNKMIHLVNAIDARTRSRSLTYCHSFSSFQSFLLYLGCRFQICGIEFFPKTKSEKRILSNSVLLITRCTTFSSSYNGNNHAQAGFRLLPRQRMRFGEYCVK